MAFWIAQRSLTPINVVSPRRMTPVAGKELSCGHPGRAQHGRRERDSRGCVAQQHQEKIHLLENGLKVLKMAF